MYRIKIKEIIINFLRKSNSYCVILFVPQNVWMNSLYSSHISYFLPHISNTIYAHIDMSYKILMVFKEIELDLRIVFTPESPF
jgi:hypothetical protein